MPIPSRQKAFQRHQAIANFAKTPEAKALFGRAKDGEVDAADEIARSTKTSRTEVLAFVLEGAQDRVWSLGGIGEMMRPDGRASKAESALQSSSALLSGGTVAHLTGFRAFDVKESGSRNLASQRVPSSNPVPFEALIRPKAAPSKEEIAQGHSLIKSLPLGDQHAHEIGSAPMERIGENIEQLTSLPLEDQQHFLEGLYDEIDSITKGGTKAFITNSVGPRGMTLTSEVIASPEDETPFRAKITRAITNLETASNMPSGKARDRRVAAAADLMHQATEYATFIGVPVADELVSATRKVEMKMHFNPLDASKRLEPFAVGVLNQMAAATARLVENKPEHNSVFTGLGETTSSQLATAVMRLRNAASLTKPNEKRWDEVAGTINGALEFFVRYKSVLGTHAGKMDGDGVADVAKRRTSMVHNNLGYQEIRADLDTDRFRRRFDKTHTEGMLTPKDLVASSSAFASAMADSDVDAFMTYSLTKRDVVPTPDDPDEAMVEAPLYAKQAEVFVDTFFEGVPGKPTADAQKMHAGINGLDHGGRESVERAPMLFIRGHAKRVVRNALELRHAIKHASPELKTLIKSAVGNDDALKQWQAIGKNALQPENWTASVAGKHLPIVDTKELQRALGSVVNETPQDWKIDIGPISVEELSRVNRAVLDAMRTHAAMKGESVDVPQLGATVHAGEQIRFAPPDVLLDQIAQCLAMGADRLGHGVILGTAIQSLYEPGPGGKLWPKMLSEEKRADPKNAVFAKTYDAVDALDNSREELLRRVINNGVVIEVNLTSNLVINDQTPADHCSNLFARKMHKGLRFTINTDDETILATTIQKELADVHSHLKLDLVDLSQLILESFRSRLGGKPLAHKEKLARQFTSLLKGQLIDGTTDETAALRVAELSTAMGVPKGAALSSTQQLERIVNKVLS